MQTYIAEYVELSSIDVEGKICDVIYFAGCDFNCPICNTPEFLSFKEEYLIDLREIKNRIKTNHAGKEAILFTGGEPCLQRLALIEIARYAKKLGIQIIIHTNASKPDTIQSLLKEKLVDKFIVDLKSPFSPEIFEKVTKSATFFKNTDSTMQDIRQSLSMIEDSSIAYEFITTITPSLIFRKEDIMDLANEIAHYNGPWTLKKFNPDTVLNAKFNSINPPSEQFMIDIKTIIEKEYPNINVDIS